MEYCERVKIEEEDKGIVSIHLARYDFAREFSKGKRVLDCVCGTGYGSTALHNAARSLIGVDWDSDAICYAQQTYLFPNVEFLVMEATHLGFRTGSFDTICSFETIEHLKDPEVYLWELIRVLHSGGVCLISTPNAYVSTSQPENPYHVQEWARGDFEKFLRRFFRSVTVLSVNRKQTLGHEWVRKMDCFQLRRFAPRLFRSKLSRWMGTTAFHEMELKKDIDVGPYSPSGLSMLAVCQEPKRG